MEKKFDIEDELEMLLDDQLMKEAELLEKELFADDGFEDYQETPEERNASYEKLVNRLKADGIYREETNEDNEEKERKEQQDNKEKIGKESNETKIVEMPVTSATEPGKNTIKKEKKNKKAAKAEENTKSSENEETQESDDIAKHRKMQRRLTKVAVLLIVSSLGIFTAAMTSEANRHYWLHNVRILTGRDTRDVTDNDETNESVSTDEYTAIAKIEKELQINVPEFLYRPENFDFLSCEIDSIAGVARIIYLYNDSIMDLYMKKGLDGSSSGVSGVLGEEIEKVRALHENLDVSLVKVHDMQDDLSSYYAKWKWEEVEYTLSGRIDQNELIKIVENFVY